ncbi:hypothetical protein [Bacillus mycoides]|uniref:Uncharacterized protein n=1 Tax=Bacillus mycoides TaxID=1405 RepID=A0ABC9QXD0_BACMY|nr:hypothetical protein [Bacillus mycoides]EJR31144.1 hypothetical protein III_05370 [Bacillus mycoides]
MKIFIKPLTQLVVTVVALLGTIATITAGSAIDLVKDYPWQSAGVVVIIYLTLVFKEWRQSESEKRLKEAHETSEKRLKEAHETEMANLKAEFIERKTFNPLHVPSIMGLIETHFEEGKWYRDHDLHTKIHELFHVRPTNGILANALEGLSEKGHIEIKREFNTIYFKRK